ncbi:PAPA-1-like conserved region [Penicillium italicum]|uniref:PAPA-1-like conserved region n=1 Tax=Penicillium italicum TaxID=40296 RepID=A0A0A2L6C2_PENIT|nr:PAPA-1-like conserved region [Penicillium italicum]
MTSSKLREATSAGRAAGRRSVNVFREDPIVSGPRSSRNRKKIVEVATSDEEEIDDQEEDEVDDEDAPGDDDDDEDADADVDADADGDIDMDDIQPQAPTKRGKITPPSRAKPPKSVEAEEMEMEEDEEEEEEDEEPISDTDEDAEAEGEDQDEIAVPDVNVDDLDELDEEDEIDEDMDSDALAMQSGKTTKRQRGNLGNDFLQLPMEPQVKKHLTAEERQMRRAEMARRRKNLSEKRNEEEKMDTINRLLKKQAPKRRGRAAAAEAADGTPGQEGAEAEKADPTMARWVSGSNGCRVTVPGEWLGTPAGRVFGAPSIPTGKMVEEV